MSDGIVPLQKEDDDKKRMEKIIRQQKWEEIPHLEILKAVRVRMGNQVCSCRLVDKVVSNYIRCLLIGLGTGKSVTIPSLGKFWVCAAPSAIERKGGKKYKELDGKNERVNVALKFQISGGGRIVIRRMVSLFYILSGEMLPKIRLENKSDKELAYWKKVKDYRLKDYKKRVRLQFENKEIKLRMKEIKRKRRERDKEWEEEKKRLREKKFDEKLDTK